MGFVGGHMATDSGIMRWSLSVVGGSWLGLIFSLARQAVEDCMIKAACRVIN